MLRGSGYEVCAVIDHHRNVLVLSIFCFLKLGVMTYKDLTRQSPETQAVVEQEVRKLLKVSLGGFES